MTDEEILRMVFRAFWVAGRAAHTIRPIAEIELETVVELEDGALMRIEWRLGSGAAMCRRWSNAGLPLLGMTSSHVYQPGHRLARVIHTPEGGQ